MVVENQAGAVQYRNILPSTNLEYAVTSISVKESIVVREPQSEYKYYFDMDLDGLTPVENNDGSISLTESGDTASEIFWIEAPYMYDANSDESFAVTMSLTEVEGKYVLAVEADKDWINAADRAFPVVIDPTLSLSDANIDDAFVISGLQINSLRRGKELRVGRNLTNLTRTYIKIKMPANIPKESFIQSAFLLLQNDSYFQAIGQSDVNINAYDFKSDDWSFDSLEWNNQPYGNGDNVFCSHDDDLLDSVPATKETRTYSFDILNAVKRWIATGDNRGVAIVSSDETSKTQVDCHSSRALRELDRPALCIYYSMPMIEPSSLSFNHFAETKSVRVVCGGAWVATTDSSWLAMSPQSGNDSSQLFLHVRKNSSASSRLGTVTVKRGNTVIGVLSVTQFGSDPSLLISEDSWITNCGEDSKTFAITSNDSWTVESSEPWLIVSPLSGEENGVITVNTSANDGSDTRTGTITLLTAHGTESKTISVTQLDKVSNYFYSVSENGSFGRNSSSDYNHKLATWAMELSYAAYNYPNGEELPIIPGAFMGDFTQTAGMLLEDNGFVNISEYNYTSDSRAAHTIGCRFVEFPGTRNLQSNNIGGNYNVHQHNGTNIQLPVRNLLDSVCIRDYDQGRNYFRDNTLITGEDTEISTSHDDEIETKPLVVDVRGSVTLSDWINDVMTQFDSENNRFAAFADEIFTNVENFYSVSENGSFGRNSSSDYNHKLATWAMELSYAAYNYPNGEELPIIPGAFMGDFTQTAGMLLEDNGFVNISEYNYTSDSRAAHTIGWRPVEVAVSETSQIINDAGGMDNVYQYNIDDKGSVLYNLLDQLRVDRSAHLFDERRDTGADRYDSITNSQSFAAGNKILKPLLVVDIRGSVTWWDWVNDIGAQALPFNNRFAALAEEVFTNVENFYSVSENGSFGRNSSSDYNHKLATWAMELSYAAYNYLNGEELPIIPGAFMGDFTQTAGVLLEDNGFVNISEYNYTSDDRAAHTIGCRLVEFPESENLQLNDYTGGIDNVYQYSGADLQLSVLDLLDSLSVNRHTSLSDKRRDIGVDRYDSITDSQSFSAGNIILKPLVVVDIRGSVTWWDWINDIGTQVLAHNNRFAALADEVLTNVESYLSSIGLQDPIILITGHSMGAAIANILAARLNETMDSGNIYAYTFTFTRW